MKVRPGFKKGAFFYLFIFFCFFSIQAPLAQQVYLYQTHTLAESIENPATAVFDRRECKQYDFNFLFPQLHFNLNGFGPAASYIYDRNFYLKVKEQAFQKDAGATNYFTGSYQINLLSLKVSLEKKTRTELLINFSEKGYFDFDFKNQLLNLNTSSITNFSGLPLNTNSHAFTYNQLLFGIRTDLREDLFAGVNVGFLSGIVGGTLVINNSDIVLGPNSAQVNTNGYFLSSISKYQNTPQYELKKVSNYLPNFKNPGLNLNGEIRYAFDDISQITGAIKDFGFIRWENGYLYSTKNQTIVDSSRRFDLKSEIKGNFRSFFNNSVPTHFTSYLPARLEVSYSRRFNAFFRATMVATQYVSKSVTALNAVGDASYHQYHLIVNTGYETVYNAGSLGFHFLYHAPVVEAFIGSERLAQTLRFPGQAGGKQEQGKPIGADLNLGLAIKLGSCFYYQTATDMNLDPKSKSFFHRLFEKKPVKYDRPYL